jgi:hypothetical protein
MDRECTWHHWCTFCKISKCSEIDPSLLNMNSLSFALVLIVLIRNLPLIWLPRLREFLCKVGRTPTIKATICVAWMSWLLSNRSWATLLRHWRSGNGMLLWGPENPTPLLRGLLRSFRVSILHQTIPLWQSTRGFRWCLPLLLSMVSQDIVFLSDC